MKLKELHEAAGDNAIRAWCAKHIDSFDPNKLDIEDGEIYYWVDCQLKDCSRIDHPFAEVKGDFVISAARNNAVTSLENCPKIVGRNLNIIGQPITSLKGAPSKVGSYLQINKCKKLKTFEGADKIEVGNKTYHLEDNGFESLKGINKVIPRATRLYLDDNPIKRDILGLILIQDLDQLYLGHNISRNYEEAMNIVTDYFGKGKEGMLHAQEELMDLDLDEYAGS